MAPFVCKRSGENLADLGFGFFDLFGATRISLARIGKGPARGANWQEIVENDADPFDAAGIEQKPAPGPCRGIEYQPLREPCNKAVKMLKRNRNFRLAEEIHHQLRRIVAPRIFEIEKDQLAVGGER